MKKNLLPLLIVIIGALLILSQLTSEKRSHTLPSAATVQENHAAPSLTAALRLEPLAPIPTAVPEAAFIKDLLERARWESEAAATRAAHAFRKAMLIKVDSDGETFLKRLSGIAYKDVLTKSKDEHAALLSARMIEVLNKDRSLEEELEAVCVQYFHDLERIAQEVAIQSGMDVQSLPVIELTISDFDGLLREGVRGSSRRLANSMQKEARISAVIGVASLGVGLRMPTPFLVDLAISVAIDKAIEGYRDVDVKLEALSNEAVEQLADNICLGSAASPGLYAALLDIARYHNEQLSKMLSEARLREGGRG